MQLYQILELRRKTHEKPWDILELAETLPGYDVREALSERERLDFYQQFIGSVLTDHTD